MKYTNISKYDSFENWWALISNIFLRFRMSKSTKPINTLLALKESTINKSNRLTSMKSSAKWDFALKAIICHQEKYEKMSIDEGNNISMKYA